MQSPTKVQRVTFTRGECSYLRPCLMNILGLLCNVTTLAFNVATSQRRNVILTLLLNVATLAINVATLILTLLWNVTTFQRRDVDFYYPLERRDVAPNVATLENLLSGTSRRCPERRDVALF